VIRQCGDADLDAVLEIINDGAQAYRGVIPADRWHEPYMSRAELESEVRSGIEFWGHEKDGSLLGVMGIQDRGAVTLIRHAYVRTHARRGGIGAELLRFLEARTDKPILIGTWAAAAWAITFYEKHGYRRVPSEEKTRLLRRYWTVPERQIETSVVLADGRWHDRAS
jgi:N-acetylglutamate synthase-like GNAT family acetyltransferase